MKKTKTTKSSTKKKIIDSSIKDEINSAINKLENGGDKNIQEINESLKSKNYSELVDFVLRISQSKDLQNMFRLLSRIQEQPQSFRADDEFNTIYNIAVIDGERQLVRKFANLIAHANNGDREALEKEITKNPYL